MDSHGREAHTVLKEDSCQPAVNVQTVPLICYTEKTLPAHRNWIVLVLLSGWLGLRLTRPHDFPRMTFKIVDSE